MTFPFPSYLTIPLTQDQVAIVDEEDFDWLSGWKWYARWNPCTKSFYAYRNSVKIEGIGKSIAMHRELKGLEYCDKRCVDHISRDTLDNRKSNLRLASRAENSRNTKVRIDNKTGFKGVHAVSRSNRIQYGATIRVNGRQIHLGYRSTPEEAYNELYCPAAIMYHGEFASF